MEGHVEVYINGAWGTVCSSSFDFREATVICRQLGYSRAVRYYRRAHYGRGTVSILLNKLWCKGDEEQLTHCRYFPVDWRCSHHRDASVVCA